MDGLATLESLQPTGSDDGVETILARSGLDLAGSDLAGSDLAGLDLAGLDLAGLDLAGQSALGGSAEAFPSLAADMPIRFGRVRQHTLRNPISCVGVGLHTGRTIRLTLRPAPVDSGIVFHRVDLGIRMPARHDMVIDTRLSTVIASREQPEARIATVEHVMAALAGCLIDNAIIEVDGPEIPVLDGSAAPFVFLLDCAGRQEQQGARSMIEVLRRIRVEDGAAFAELRPATQPCLSLSLSIAFPARAIGRQACSMTLTDRAFRNEVADCRTFTMLGEIEALRASGLARGGSLDNAVVVDDARVLNPAGLRRRDEFVRHKLLDAIGDLALAGQPIRGAFIGHRSGHGLNNRLLHALLSDSSAWRLSGRGVLPDVSLAA
ncbi:UDP-3-O-acyl-N-acetylglucosamine deacetylase [Lichenicoccus sp.]|uniref:UDP-3-O-acyl-N-acetylglucosamine deacetylase n=1 Tax=Lichenicoccus sp. TaxID=2781899 RepID=UPI003D0F94CA